MSKQELNTLLEEIIVKDSHLVTYERISYIMKFDQIVMEYHFSVN